VTEKDVKFNIKVNKDVDSADGEAAAEAKAVAADSEKADTEMAKLTANLEELRQTLQRRQADERRGNPSNCQKSAPQY